MSHLFFSILFPLHRRLLAVKKKILGRDWGFRGLSPSQPPQIIFLVFILISHCPYEYFDTNNLKIEHKLSSWDFLKDPPPNKKYETVTGFRRISPLQTPQIFFLVFFFIGDIQMKILISTI